MNTVRQAIEKKINIIINILEITSNKEKRYILLKQFRELQRELRMIK